MSGEVRVPVLRAKIDQQQQELEALSREKLLLRERVQELETFVQKIKEALEVL